MRFTRFLYSNNSIINDWSPELNKYQSGTQTFTFVASQDYFYIGNIARFNHAYLKLATLNTANTSMTVEYFSGTTNEWTRAVELIDETQGLTQSGFITWVPDKNDAWEISDCKYDALGNVTFSTGRNNIDSNDTLIYDKYWIRISFNNDLDVGTELSWAGQKFSDDDDLGAEFPDLIRSNVKTAFESGKTDWEEQHVRAAEIIVQDLISKKVIFTKNQILERRSFTLASVYKVAQMIFNSFGDDYVDQKLAAKSEYEKRLDTSIYDVDLNLDGELDQSEMFSRQGFLKR